MSDRKSYAMFNTLTITGRLSFAEVVKGTNGDYLAVTLISELTDGSEGIAVSFTTNNGLMSLFNKGYLQSGRMITVTGHLNKFEETYFNKQTGKRAILQRPRLTLGQAQVLHGGLGAGAKREELPEIDKTPAFAGGPTLDEIEM
jgi:hypothetical protein